MLKGVKLFFDKKINILNYLNHFFIYNRVFLNLQKCKYHKYLKIYN